MKKIVLSLASLTVTMLSAQNVQTFTLKKLPSKPVNELLTRGMISGEQ